MAITFQKTILASLQNPFFFQVKPLLNIVRVEDELKAKDEEIADLKDKLEKEETLRKDYEEKCVTLLAEKNDLTIQLQAVSETIQIFVFS